MEELSAAARTPPTAGWSCDDPAFEAFFQRLHAGRRSWRCCSSARGRPAAPAAGRPRARCARSRGCSPGRRRACPGAGLVRRRHALATPPRPIPTACACCARLYRDWPFFRTLIEAVEMALAKSSTPEVAGLPRPGAGGEPTATGCGSASRDEHDLAVDARADGDASRASCSTAIRCCSGRSRAATRSSTPLNAVAGGAARAAGATRRSDEDAREAVRAPLARTIAGIAAGAAQHRLRRLPGTAARRPS